MRVCHYRPCDREAFKGWTTCALHRSAGISVAHYRRAAEQRAREHHCPRCGTAARGSDPAGLCSDCQAARPGPVGQQHEAITAKYFRGGQGRSSESVAWSGHVLFWLGCLAFWLVVFLVAIGGE